MRNLLKAAGYNTSQKFFPLLCSSNDRVFLCHFELVRNLLKAAGYNTSQKFSPRTARRNDRVFQSLSYLKSSIPQSSLRIPHSNSTFALMPPKPAAGILLYKLLNGQPLVFLVHPGGPFWKNKHKEAWSVPKGEIDEGEDTLTAARREFEEETGQQVHGEFVPLEPVTQRSGKRVYAWAVEGDIDTATVVSNVFDFEWPPRSGKFISIPEVDRGEWFDIQAARVAINPGQLPLLNNLLQILAAR